MTDSFRAWLLRTFGAAFVDDLMRESDELRRRIEIPLGGPHYTRHQAQMDEHHAPPVSAEVEAFIQSTERRPK